MAKAKEDTTILTVLGAPGAGKGTCCKFLAVYFRVPHISTGDLFRAAVSAGTPLGRDAKSYMDKGALVPDTVTLGLVRERMGQGDCGRGFILDGFPRNPSQAGALDAMLGGAGLGLSAAVHLEVADQVVVERLSGRRLCRDCAEGNFNIYTQKPRKEGVCDFCGGELYQRDDDREEVIRRRLEVYRESTAPLVTYYRGKGLLTTVSGAEGSPQEVASKVVAALEGVLAAR